MSQPYVGEIRLGGWNFAPNGWSFCDGSTIAISQFETLFNLIGTTYGGNGQSTFQLPDLRGRVVIHQGSGYVIGEQSGSETVTITTNQLPAHTHPVQVGTTVGTTNDPSGHFITTAPLALGNTYVPATSETAMATAIPASGGSGQPHDNIQPYQAINYV